MCKFHFSIAIAIIKPPKYKKIYLCPYDSVASEISKIFVIGNKIIGNNDVAAIGTASVAHHKAIHKTMPIIYDASLGIICELLKNVKIKNKRGPNKREINF